MTTCRSCHRPVRPSHMHVAERPGTIPTPGRGLCITCYRHRRDEFGQLPRERKNAYVVDEVEFMRGESLERTAESLGMSLSAVARALYRAGRHDLARPFERAAQRARRAALAKSIGGGA